MRIRITRKGSRNLLHCTRVDGSVASADLGPNLPHHDLAHFVVERAFGLQDGFFGNIQRGYTPAQLSDKEFIRQLGVEPYRAEILARALGSMATGACTSDQFEELVNTELSRCSLSTMHIPADVLEAMMAEFQGLLSTYRGLQDGEGMALDFKVPAAVRL